MNVENEDKREKQRGRVKSYMVLGSKAGDGVEQVEISRGPNKIL